MIYYHKSWTVQFQESRPPGETELYGLPYSDAFEIMAAWVNWKLELKFEALKKQLTESENGKT